MYGAGAGILVQAAALVVGCVDARAVGDVMRLDVYLCNNWRPFLGPVVTYVDRPLLRI